MQYNYEPFYDLSKNSLYNQFYNDFKGDNYHGHHSREQENEYCDFKDLEFQIWVEEQKTISTKYFNKEYKRYVNNGIYFYGCPQDLYIKTYPERLKNFLQFYMEGSEIFFIESELRKGIEKINYFISDKEIINMSFSLKNRLTFLKDRLYNLGYEIRLNEENEYRDKFNLIKISNHKTKLSIPKLTWMRTNVELAELIKALIQIRAFGVKYTEKEIFDAFSLFFNFKINKTVGIRDFSKRPNNGGVLTLFLDKLRDGLYAWYERKEEKKRTI